MRSILSLVFLLAAAPSSVSAQVASALVRVGDPLVGAPPGHVVFSIRSVAVNQVGGFVTVVTTTNGSTYLDHIWGSANGGPGAILRTMQNGIAGYDQLALAQVGIDDTGRLFYRASVRDLATGASGLGSAWLDSTPLAVQGSPIPTLPGKAYAAVDQVSISGSGLPSWGARFVDIATGAAEGSAFFAGTAATVLTKTGDHSPPPLTSTLIADTVNVNARFSASGTHWINMLVTDQIPLQYWIQIDGGLGWSIAGTPMGESQPIPASVGGLPGENWGIFDQLGINEAGDRMFTGFTSDQTGHDRVIAKNGVVLWREGQTIDGLTLNTSPLQAFMNESGDIAFLWATNEAGNALFVNGAVAVKTGDPVDWDGDGVADPGATLAFFIGTNSLSMSPAALGGTVWFIGRAHVGADLRNALFHVATAQSGTPCCFGDGVATSCPCGNAGGIGAGCSNSSGHGGLLESSGIPSVAHDTLALASSGLPATLGLFIQGSSAVNNGTGAPFGAGLRCVGGSVVRLKTVPTSGGTAVYPASGDAPVSVRGAAVAGDVRYYQFWYRDALVPCGTGSNWTNGIRAVWAP